MGEEPTWLELLFVFVMTAVVPTVVGLTVICSVVGLTLWVRAALRRRRGAKQQPRGASESPALPGTPGPTAPEELQQLS